MISKIVDFFNSNMGTVSTESTENKSDRISLATCALLLEMAHADSEFGDEEKNLIISILEDRFNLGKNDAVELLELANLERKESLDLWQFTNMINEKFSRQDKLDVLTILWSVVYADGKVDMHEEYLMRKLSSLLDMKHSEMIETKIQARDNS